MWKDIDGYSGLYQVSDMGCVKSLGRVIPRPQGNLPLSERVLKPGLGTDGYYYVSLSTKRKTTSFPIHRLVAKAFIDNPNNLPCVNHKDEVKTNNELHNLEWCSYSYNNTYNGLEKRRIKNVDFASRSKNTDWGKRKQNTDFVKRTANTDYKQIGLNKRKPVEQINIYTGDVVKTWAGGTIDIGEYYNVKPTRIQANCLGKAKVTLGYKWRYVNE